MGGPHQGLGASRRLAPALTDIYKRYKRSQVAVESKEPGRHGERL